MLAAAFITAALLTIAGSFGSWYTLNAYTKSGTDYGDGWGIIVLATLTVLAVVGFYIRGARWMAISALIFCICNAVLAVGNWASLSDGAADTNTRGLFTASVESGLELAAFASILMLACTGYLVLRRK